MLVDTVHSFDVFFSNTFFMRGIHTSNIINSIKFPSAPFHQNLQAIFAKHRMTTRHQHHIAWLGQTNDTEALLFRQKWTPSWWEIFADLGFLGLDLTKVTKKGGWFFTNSTSILTKIIQNIQNLLIHFKWKIPILILHPILHTPPSKKQNKEIGPHPNVVPHYLSHKNRDAAIGQQPEHCESVVPGVQTSAAPREAQASLLTSWEAFTQAPIPIPCEQNQATTATLLPNTGYFARKLLWVSSCYTPRRLQSLFRFKVQ